jgi:hypothetical protein
LAFEKNADCFAENCRKSLKIVIITWTLGHADIDTWSGVMILCSKSSLLAMAAQVDSSQQSPRTP